ncbi:hypothetical protein AKJ16_DCAP13199 [Drosera capensis]
MASPSVIVHSSGYTALPARALVRAIYLARLPSYLDSVRSTLLSAGGNPTLTSIFTTTPDSVAPASTFVIQDSSHDCRTFNRGRPRGRGTRGGEQRGSGGRSSENLHCTHCGRSNHVEATCWKKHGYPDQSPAPSAWQVALELSRRLVARNGDAQRALLGGILAKSIAQLTFDSVLHSANFRRSHSLFLMLDNLNTHYCTR